MPSKPLGSWSPAMSCWWFFRTKAAANPETAQCKQTAKSSTQTSGTPFCLCGFFCVRDVALTESLRVLKHPDLWLVSLWLGFYVSANHIGIPHGSLTLHSATVKVSHLHFSLLSRKVADFYFFWRFFLRLNLFILSSRFGGCFAYSNSVQNGITTRWVKMNVQKTEA